MHLYLHFLYKELFDVGCRYLYCFSSCVFLTFKALKVANKRAVWCENRQALLPLFADKFLSL